MVNPRVLFWFAMLCAGVPASAEQAWRLGPDHYSLRHPVFASVELSTEPFDGPLRFYRTPELSGVPAMVLDEDGLTVEGRLRCRWYRASGSAASEMRLLGFTAHAEDGRRPDPECSADLPVSGKVSDGGFGPFIVSIQIAGWRGFLFEVPFRRGKLYLDARQLPGDANPNLPERPPFSLPRRGRIGWVDQALPHEHAPGVPGTVSSRGLRVRRRRAARAHWAARVSAICLDPSRRWGERVVVAGPRLVPASRPFL